MRRVRGVPLGFLGIAKTMLRVWRSGMIIEVSDGIPVQPRGLHLPKKHLAQGQRHKYEVRI